MIQIRHNIFETNSSSTHSLSYKFKKFVGNTKINIENDGTVIVNGIDQRTNFYNTDYVVSGEFNKLNYVFSWMFLRDDSGYQIDRNEDYVIPDEIFWPENLEDCQNRDQYKNLLEAINKKYTNLKAKRFKLLNGGHVYFDHQTSPWEMDCIINLDDPDEIYKLLFNDHLCIIIGHD